MPDSRMSNKSTPRGLGTSKSPRIGYDGNIRTSWLAPHAEDDAAIKQFRNDNSKKVMFLTISMGILMILAVTMVGSMANAKPKSFVQAIFHHPTMTTTDEEATAPASFSDLLDFCKKDGTTLLDVKFLDSSILETRSAIEKRLFLPPNSEGQPNSCQSENLALLYLAMDMYSSQFSLLQLQQRWVLATFYVSTKMSEESSNWLTETDECTWQGVVCVGDIITELVLPEANLGGTMPSNLSLLSRLTVLELPNNQIGGTLPDLVALTNLATLFLESNRFTGTVPPSLFNVNNKLGVLHLADNALTGTIPLSLLHKKDTLTSLTLGDNQFTGQIGARLYHMTNLQTLELNNMGNENAFRTTLTSDIGLMTNLIIFDAGQAQLHGTIPSEIGLLEKQLVYLNLYGNTELHGQVPSELGLLTNLEYLDLSAAPQKQTYLKAPFPTQVCHLANGDIQDFVAPPGACSDATSR